MPKKYLKINFEIMFDEEKHEYTLILEGQEIKANLSVTQALKQAVEKGYCDWKDIKVIGE